MIQCLLAFNSKVGSKESKFNTQVDSHIEVKLCIYNQMKFHQEI